MDSLNETPGEVTEAQPAPGRVGYGNPPQSTRFRKGQSGNPKGRPKGSLNVSTVLTGTLREKVVINENGQRRAVTKLEAALKQLVNKAASGDLRAVVQLIVLAREAEEKESLPTTSRSEIGEVDQKIMQRILKRFEDSARAQQEETDETHSV